MAVMRLGYVHARVTDMDDAKRHYIDTMGLMTAAEEDNKLYLRGWDEWNHHSVVLESGGVGLVKMGYKVEKPEDLDYFENKARTFGVTTERMSDGDNLATGDGVRITLPSDHILELYSDMEYVDNAVGFNNPNAQPRHPVGVSAPNIDHLLITAEDPGLAERFFMEVLDFFPTERVRPTLDSTDVIGSWLSASQKIHDIAIIGGPNGKLHHFAFELGDWSDVGHAADIMSMDEVSFDVTPTRHGITRGQTIYFFDPAGNRNEVFAGGYRAYRDRPCVTWSADQLGRGIFYHSRELNDRFTSVLT